MDMSTGIASMAMSMQQASLQASVSIAVMSKALGTGEIQADTLLQDFTQNNPTAPTGSVGASFDVRA